MQPCPDRAPVVHNLPVSTDPLLLPFSAPARPELTDHATTRVGVLLSHGFTGSPASMRPWAEFLAEQGYAVEVPLLPGHGTTWQEMNLTTWDDWYAEVSRSFDRLAASNDTVVVAGLSMGGALALRLAADRPDEVAGLLLVNAAVASTNKQLKLVPVVRHLVKSMPGIGNDVKKAGVVEHGYDRTPLNALHSMVGAWRPLRAALPQVTAPIRFFRSTEDHVVDPSSAQIVRAAVSSRRFEEVLLENSYHVATLDNDAPRIFDSSLEFIRSLA